MTNPEVSRGKTPNGGAYSELWYLTKDGNVAKSMDEATSFRILEKDGNGEIIQETYGKL